VQGLVQSVAQEIRKKNAGESNSHEEKDPSIPVLEKSRDQDRTADQDNQYGKELIADAVKNLMKAHGW